MKINLITPALLALLGLALASAPAQAQTTPTATTSTTAIAPAASPAPAKAPKSAKIPYKGSITALDATSVTVTTTQKTLLLEITPKTKFKKDKAVAGIGDFAVGDLVTGSYSVDPTGALTANTLHKKTPKMPHVTTTAAVPATPAAPATPATPAAQ